MAITLDQDDGDAGNAASSPGPAVSLNALPGQAAIVTGLVFSTASTLAITGITDNGGGNTWVFSTTPAQKPPYQKYHAISQSGYIVCFIGWCLSLTSTISTVSISDNTGLSDFWRVSTSSWTGIVQDDNGASAVFGATAAPAATVNLRNSGDLVVGVANNDSTSFTGSPTGGGGWTDFVGAGTKPNLGFIFPGSTGSYTATWTLSGTDDAAAALVQAFSPAIIPPASVAAVPAIVPGESSSFAKLRLLGLI